MQYSGLHFSAAIVTLFAAIIFNVYFKNILSAMPILLGLIVGYLYSASDWYRRLHTGEGSELVRNARTS